MKNFIQLMLTLLLIPVVSSAAVVGKVIVPDNLLKWERQADLDEYFNGKHILLYSSEDQEVIVSLPANGDEV